MAEQIKTIHVLCLVGGRGTRRIEHHFLHVRQHHMGPGCQPHNHFLLPSSPSAVSIPASSTAASATSHHIRRHLEFCPPSTGAAGPISVCSPTRPPCMLHEGLRPPAQVTVSPTTLIHPTRHPQPTSPVEASEPYLTSQAGTRTQPRHSMHPSNLVGVHALTCLALPAVHLALLSSDTSPTLLLWSLAHSTGAWTTRTEENDVTNGRSSVH